MPTNPKLQLDRTGRFLAAPVASVPGQLPETISLHQHLAWLERVCGN